MALQGSKNGQFYQTDFADNTGGINLSDSVFKIKDTQASGGLNFDYTLTGGIKKRLGPAIINTVADTELKTLGFGVYGPASGASKSVLRAAGDKLQYFDTSAATFTALSQDNSTASSTPFSSSSTETVQFTQFNNGVSNILWAAGGGSTLPIGAYSTTKYTQNGIDAPTGAFTATVNSHNSGGWSTTGTFFYSVAYHKASTAVLSNAALDISATVVNTDDTVTINLAGLSNLDTTLVDEIYLYRSAVSGVTEFTTGSLVAKISSSTSSFVDKGQNGNPDFLSTDNVPRAGNTVLDNSVLPAGTYNAMGLFKRRLVVAQDSTLYLSDVNKSESWPTANPITVPSAGNITGLAVISFTSPQAQSLDEILVIFKEREMWVLTGNDITDWALKFIDQVGCPDQSLIVLANGFLSWIDFRGIYLWDGSSKPIYCSRLIEPLFSYGGDLDKTKLVIGSGEFFRRENQVVWYLSSKTYGEQKFAIKMDLRLTLPQIEQTLTGRNIDAVIAFDTYAMPIYASMSYIPTNGSQEELLLGDDAGFCYHSANGYGDADSGIDFSYLTPPLCMGDPNTKKQFHSVIAWVQDIGDWNIELDYWADYKTSGSYASTKVLPISTESQTAALWDVATWDLSYWDDYSPSIIPVVFNLSSQNINNAQGSAIQLQFSNSNANEPIVIHGFSVLWSPLGGITA